MRIIFLTNKYTVDNISGECLKKLIKSKKNVIAVGLGLNSKNDLSPFPPLNIVAEEYNIPIIEISDLNERFTIKTILAMKPDLIITCAFRFIVPGEIIQNVDHIINLHPALLPKYRGAHPENWAIINGETETGITVHFLTEKIDQGPIIAQERVNIDPLEDINDLSEKLRKIAPTLLINVVSSLEKGTITTIPQSEEQASYFPPRRPEDGLINWNDSCVKVFNMIRALKPPFPGAFSYIKGKKITILEAMPKKGVLYSDPGKIIKIDGKSMIVSTSDGVLQINSVYIDPVIPIKAVELMRYLNLKEGESFDGY